MGPLTSKTVVAADVRATPAATSFTSRPETVGDVFRCLARNPWRSLVLRWNWKSAACSSAIRANIFFFVTLQSGWRAALGAFTAELLYRVLTSGFYGTLTQSFSGAQPAWAGAATVMILLPLSSHSMEFAIHSLRHTPHLKANIMTSVGFTIISTLFNWYAMRKGSLIVGSGAKSVGKDMQSIPRLIAEFVAAGPLALWRLMRALLWPKEEVWSTRPLHEPEDAPSD